MKYAILGPQDGILRVRDTAPLAGVRHVEVTDEQAATIASLTMPIWLDGGPTTRAAVTATGDRLRWDADLGKLVRTPKPTPPPRPTPVPKEVPLWAFREALRTAALWDSALAVIATLPAEQRATVTNFLEYGNFVRRDSPTLAALATALGQSPAQIDAVFTTADGLVI